MTRRVTSAVLVAVAVLGAAWWLSSNKRRHLVKKCAPPFTTPLVRIASLSDATGCTILGKCEFLSVGGSVKDRVASRIVDASLASGALRPGGLVCEGSAGSTGVSLALVCASRGLRCFVACPSDAAQEKAATMRALGAVVEVVPPVGITHPGHFVNVARAKAWAERAAHGGDAALFLDQFESTLNFDAHFETTGPEIWAQAGGALAGTKVHAFVAGAGTGGTLAGVAAYLRSRDANITCYLVDPPGSGLYNRVTKGVMFDAVEADGTRAAHPCDTHIEGVGINRLTANFLLCPRLDGAFRVNDDECVAMSRHLLRSDGLWLGGSAALNCVGALRVAMELGPGHTVVTVLCDGGAKHVSKFWSPEWLASVGLDAFAARGLDWLMEKAASHAG